MDLGVEKVNNHNHREETLLKETTFNQNSKDSFGWENLEEKEK